MDTNVDLLHEIIKFNERCVSVGASNCVLKLNDLNGNG